MIRFAQLAVLTLVASLLMMVPGSTVGRAQEATPEANCAVTTLEENEALATSYWEEVWWGDQGKIAEIVAPDEVHHWSIGDDTTGFEEFSQRLNQFFTAFPDLKFTVDLVAAEGNFGGNALDGNRHASRRVPGYRA